MNNGSTGFFFCALHLTVVLCFVPHLGAQEITTVGTVDVRGVSVFSPNELLAGFGTKPGDPFSAERLNTDLDRLIAKFRNEGYLFGRVDSVSTQTLAGKTNLIVYVDEGKQALIDTIVFEGDSALTDGVLRPSLMFKEGSPFVQSEIEAGAGAILRKYEEAGFPFAAVSVSDVELHSNAGKELARFVYKITEGRHVSLKELRVEGNTTTRASVVTREARLRVDDVYSDELSSKIRRRLERLQLFSSVTAPEFFLNEKGEGALLVKVTEGNPNRFDGIVGYVPSPKQGESGYVTGLVDLQFRNLFGTGRRFSARWNRETQSTQEIALEYYEPWIASYPLNGDIGFVQRIQDSTYVRRTFTLAVDLSLNDQLSVGGVFSRTNVIPSESFGRSILAESQETSAGVSVKYDTRSDPVTPISGLFYSSEYDIGSKSASSISSSPSSRNSTQRILMELAYYVETFTGQVAAADLHIQDYRSGFIELGDLFRLGGANSLRGYREGQFLGSRLVWTNVEYRFMVSRRSFLFGFTDAAYIVTPGQPLAGLRGSELTKAGYGVGIRLDTSLGLIGVSIGFGEGDTFSTAKLHLRLVNAF
ncbi:MAG TPA: POTRA domain-containing protein [Bacteroidota bacterium]